MTDEVGHIAQSFYDAVNQVMRGDAAPMLTLWSAQDDVTYLDPRGGVHQGRAAIVAYWQHAAQMNSGAPGAIVVTPEPLAVWTSGNLTCAVTREHIQITQDGQTRQEEARATALYRREAGAWRMIHRQSEPTRPTNSDAEA
jgi:uncharacterized protein (TIGR02246 family)